MLNSTQFCSDGHGCAQLSLVDPFAVSLHEHKAQRFASAERRDLQTCTVLKTAICKGMTCLHRSSCLQRASASTGGPEWLASSALKVLLSDLSVSPHFVHMREDSLAALGKLAVCAYRGNRASRYTTACLRH